MSNIEEGCTVEVGDPDGPVVVHRATGTERRHRLAQAAHAYSVVSHPGIIRMVSYSAGEPSTPAELRTRFAGSRTLATSPPRSAATLAGTMAAVAATVSGMHDIGFSHGRLTADHVIVAAGGRPILCGLGTGTERGDSPASFTCRTARSKDCRELGAITNHLLDDLDPIGRRPLAAFIELRRRSRLAEVARSATSDCIDAADLAERFASLSGPGIGLSDATEVADADDLADAHVSDVSGVDPDRRQRSSRLLASTALIGVGCWLTISGLTSVLRSADHTHESAPIACPRNTEQTRGHPGTHDGTQPGGLSCGPHVTVRGRQITIAGYRYLVGRPGDVVQVGDWDGNGIVTPALLRPATGEIFFFDRWPSADHPETVPARTLIPGATGIRLASGPTHAAQLIVTRSRLPAVTVTMPTTTKVETTP